MQPLVYFYSFMIPTDCKINISFVPVIITSSLHIFKNYTIIMSIVALNFKYGNTRKHHMH